MLKNLGLENRVLELPETPLERPTINDQNQTNSTEKNSPHFLTGQTTRTAADAAIAVKCGIGQIAKSIVFKTKTTQKPVLVIASGINRISEGKIAKILKEGVEKADADFVLEKTGYTIGGVPPAGHKELLLTFIDEDLLKFQEIWAAAGSAHAVFKLTPEELIKISKGQIIDSHD